VLVVDAKTQTPAFRWDDARVLLALLRTGSLKGAAQRLEVNASTVSRRLDALEAALATRLFDRTPDGVRATWAAEQLLPHAEQLELAADGMSRAVEGFETEPEGTVRIAAPPGVSDHFVAPALVDLARQFPRIRVELLAGVAYADLTRREADLALRTKRPSAGDLVARKFGDVPAAILASRAYVRRVGRLRTLGDARWITWGAELSHLPVARWVADHVPESAVVLRTDIGSQVAAALSGLGVVVLPSIYIGVGGLVEVELDPELEASLAPLPDECLWLVGHRALRNVPRIAAVWSFLEQFLLSAKPPTSKRG